MSPLAFEYLEGLIEHHFEDEPLGSYVSAMRPVAHGDLRHALLTAEVITAEADTTLV